MNFRVAKCSETFLRSHETEYILHETFVERSIVHAPCTVGGVCVENDSVGQVFEPFNGYGVGVVDVKRMVRNVCVRGELWPEELYFLRHDHLCLHRRARRRQFADSKRQDGLKLQPLVVLCSQCVGLVGIVEGFGRRIAFCGIPFPQCAVRGEPLGECVADKPLPVTLFRFEVSFDVFHTRHEKRRRSDIVRRQAELFAKLRLNECAHDRHELCDVFSVSSGEDEVFDGLAGFGRQQGDNAHVLRCP